jgi:hypothetical protein
MSIEKRLQAVEDALMPKPGTLGMELWWRDRVGPDEDVTRISNFFPHRAGREPEPGDKTWEREPGETYGNFRTRVRSEVVSSLPGGECGALFYEHGNMEAGNVTN